MKRFTQLAITALVLAMPSIAFAEALVITNRPVTQQELVKAVKDCDKNILVESCSAIVERFNNTFQIPKLADHNGLSEWFSNLEKKTCTNGVDCLYDNQLKLYVVSLAGAAVEQPAQKDHWATKEECLSAQGAPFYVPSITSDKPLRKDEVILPHPTGGCFEIDLPDRLTEGFPKKGRGWVRGSQGVSIVYNVKRRKAVRYAKCDNDIYQEVPFELPGVSPNPFEVRESSSVQAPDLARQGREAAERFRVEPFRDPRKHSDGPAWYSVRRTSGQVFWGAVAAGAGTAIYCAVREGGCWMNTNTNINRNYNY